jgi:hypothetical protein
LEEWWFQSLLKKKNEPAQIYIKSYCYIEKDWMHHTNSLSTHPLHQLINLRLKNYRVVTNDIVWCLASKRAGSSGPTLFALVVKKPFTLFVRQNIVVIHKFFKQESEFHEHDPLRSAKL